MTKSEHYWELQKNLTPNGSQTLSKMPSRFIEGVYPKLLHRGLGAIVWDLGKNFYVDMIAGLGAISVGYCNEQINKIVLDQLNKGIIFSLPNHLEASVSYRLSQLIPFTEQWKFLKTGTEATTAAVKCARAYTKRDKVMVCGYHGWADWYSIINDRKAGIPQYTNEYVTKAQYNNLDTFRDILSGQYAALIIEPYVFDMPKVAFFDTLRDWCSKSGTVLIFDEIVTGGRTEKFCATNLFDIKPDLIVLSKALANGFPLSAIGGECLIMQTFERDDFFVSGTFGGECISLAVCLETLNILNEAIPKMIKYGKQIQDYFNNLFTPTKAICKGYPTRLTFDFPTQAHKALWMQEMCLHGILTGYSNMVMADYTQEDVDQICEAIKCTYNKMMLYWNYPKGALKGSMPVESLKLR